ncbi:MAG: 4Fe-4S dicluster domain-containing protein, partial [Planctomycetes bacterium]|nr:4Fe-4S dicluster domain-containing protein [Planctomycetota bacterium]
MATKTKEQELFDLIDIEDFKDRVVCGYNDGSAELGLAADLSVARSIIAPGTAALRDFSYIGPDAPVLDNANCVGCMECVTECPDTAILGKVVPADEYERRLAAFDTDAEREQFAGHFNRTRKFYDAVEKKGGKPGMFGIFIDPTKCKGCAECVEVCGEHNALHMEVKDDRGLEWFKTGWRHFLELPDTPAEYINERVLTDMMLSSEALSTFTGGAGSCMGCGEVSALRMMLAATAFVHGKDNIGLVAATGCNTVYASTYPYNPYTVPWMNSLFENAATTAAGVRLRWDQMGWGEKKIWTLGGDGGMIDIGFQALSRLLASGMDVNVMILDTQVYSNTGGQTSTASFFGQEAKLSAHGKARGGKVERRKEAGQIAMVHPAGYVAPTTAAHPNHLHPA